MGHYGTRSFQHDEWLCSEPCTRTKPYLFDLRADAGERVHVASQHPSIVAAMLATLRELRKEFYTLVQPPSNAPTHYCEATTNDGGCVGPWLH